MRQWRTIGSPLVYLICFGGVGEGWALIRGEMLWLINKIVKRKLKPAFYKITVRPSVTINLLSTACCRWRSSPVKYLSFERCDLTLLPVKPTSTQDLHSCPARFRMMLQLSSKPFNSVSIVCRRVFLSLPCLRLPSSVQWSAVLGKE